MKRFLLTLVLLIATTFAFAQKSVKYSHKSLMAMGCDVTMTVRVDGDDQILTISMSSEKLAFTNSPVLMLKTFDGDVIRVEGEYLHATTETAGIFISGIMIPISSQNHIAEFVLTQEQIDLLGKGICKIRLNTTPRTHEKEFKRDKIGAKLHKMFVKAQQEAEEF